MNCFSTILKNLRHENNINQKDLAKIIKYSQSTISDWEKGAIQPSADALLAIAKFFSVTTDYLLGIEQDEYNPNIDLIISNDEIDLVKMYSKLDNFQKAELKGYIKGMLSANGIEVKR